MIKRKLLENLKRVSQRITEACERFGRDSSGVTMVAVTKYAGLDVIRSLLDLGVENLGESRVLELTHRAAMVNEWLARRAHNPADGPRPRPKWHLIGHLQRNKVKSVLPWVALIHSVDSLRLAEEIDNQSGKIARRTPILIEVNAAGESGKYGVAVAATTHLIEQIVSLEHIEVRGLMAMAPLTDDQARIRNVFERVRELFEEVVSQRLCGSEFRELSLGMSNDFEYGIEAGATYVRIGSALLEGIELGAETAQVE